MRHRTRTAVLAALPLVFIMACGSGATAPRAMERSLRPSPASTLPPDSGTTPVLVPPPPEARQRYAYVFPLKGCRYEYSSKGHGAYPATDIFAHAGCAFVAPIAGRVDEVRAHDRWSPKRDKGSLRGGRFVSIVGVDGVRYYGSHLKSVARGIRPGVKVRAGQLLGRVGNSGDARHVTTHLHFGISWPTRHGVWWVRRGEVNPSPYLDSWRHGKNASPAAAVAKKHRAAGSHPRCEARC